MKRFIDKYKLNIDYIKNNNNINKKIEKGDILINYMINLDTFEKICMMSKSLKANKVRDYFIILRKFIHYYKNNISDMIVDNIIKKKYDYIYILLVNKNKNIFKIGKTENIKKRLHVYQTGKEKHLDIQFIMIVKNKNFIETCIKTLMEKYQYKKNQEIYKINIELIKKFIFNCADLTMKNDEILDDKKVDSYIIFDNDKEIKKSSKKSSKKL